MIFFQYTFLLQDSFFKKYFIYVKKFHLKILKKYQLRVASFLFGVEVVLIAFLLL